MDVNNPLANEKDLFVILFVDLRVSVKTRSVLLLVRGCEIEVNKGVRR